MKLRIKKIRISKNEWISFVLTLVATLVGVLLAIWLTNSGVRNKEKEDTIKLLHTAKLILSNTKQYSNGLNKTILKFEKDTVNNSKERLELLKANNPIPYPDLLETIVSNELISKNVSEYSHNSIYNNLINLKKLSKYETAEYYFKLLEEMMLNLDLEIELLKGKININHLESKFEREKKKIENKYTTKGILEVETY